MPSRHSFSKFRSNRQSARAIEGTLEVHTLLQRFGHRIALGSPGAGDGYREADIATSLGNPRAAETFDQPEPVGAKSAATPAVADIAT